VIKQIGCVHARKEEIDIAIAVIVAGSDTAGLDALFGKFVERWRRGELGVIDASRGSDV
jgi:hypothetical protein